MGSSKETTRTFNLGFELAVTSLKELRLAGLPIKQINRFSLPSSLEILNLTACGLTSIPSDTFADMSLLKLLMLGDNKLSTLPANLFVNMKLGGQVILSQNRISVGQKLVVNQLNLLDLSNNHITDINNVISNGSITNLILSNNEISIWNITYKFNTKYRNIYNLNISNNNIPVINSIMALSLNSLKSVDIGGNPFECQDCSLKVFQNWITTTNTEIITMGDYNDSLLCSLPTQQKGVLLLDAKYNIFACHYTIIIIIIIIGSAIALFLITFTIYYSYRYEIAYMRHLYRVKRKQGKVAERDGCKYDVFVSYSSKDRDWVIDVLLPSLENPTDQFSLCLHERDFPLGSYIMDNIVSCIDQSRRVVLVLTNNYIRSEWCKWELQMAQHRIFEECPDLLILLELERLPRDHVPLHLRVLMDSRTYLEWPGADQSEDLLSSFWARMKQALGTPLAVSGAFQNQVCLQEEERNEVPLVPFQPLHI